MKEFKVGDKVHDIITNWSGVVNSKCNNATYPISVSYECGEHVSYTKDGKYQTFDAVRRLYHEHEKVEIKVTERKPKYRVVVRDLATGELTVSNWVHESLESYNDGNHRGVAIELIKSTETWE